MDRDVELKAPERRPSAPIGRSVVAVIGIDQYMAWPRLNNAVNDAVGAAQMFTRLGFEEVTPPLLDDAATGDAMRRLVTEDLARLEPSDSLVVFFAGHGHTHTVHYGDVSVKTGFVVPVDGAGQREQIAASWLRLDSWLSDVARLPPRHILVIIDACHSGVALGALIKWRTAAPGAIASDELQARRSRRVITSALDDQRAMDSGPYPGHSLFTGCLIEALSGGLSQGGRRVATGSEIGLYVQHRVSTYPMSQQTPDFGAFELDDRGEILVPVVSTTWPGPASWPGPQPQPVAPDAPRRWLPTASGSVSPLEPVAAGASEADNAAGRTLVHRPAELSASFTATWCRDDTDVQVMAPPHELLVELGRGGMGVVHLARRGDGQLLVVKRLRPDLARNVSVRRSFLEEARIAARIKHPNVVEVLATGFDARGVPWLEMEWAPGVSLQALTDAAPLSWDLYVAVMAELLVGLHAAHTVVGDDGKILELVHRDVSPHNVLVTYDGHAKVIDFGIAKVRDSTLDTTTGVVKGKATYLAPEQAARGRIDARTDLFAVGVMLWQQLAGRRMWGEANELEIFHRLSSHDIPDLRMVAPDVDEPVVRVVQRALEPDPDARFPTALALRDALLAVCPPRANATVDLARHVRECFADQLHEIEELVRTRRRLADTFTHDIDSGTTSLLRTMITSNKATRRRMWLVVSIPLGLAAIIATSFIVGRDPTVAPAATPCATDEDCGAKPSCDASGTCAPPAHDGCTVFLPDTAAASHPIYLGAMFPLAGSAGNDYGRANAHAAKLAVSEVNRLAGGVPVGTGRRPLGLVLCDDAVDSDRDPPKVEDRARYLATHVPAVMGFRTSDEALALSRNVFIPSGVLVLLALNQSPVLAQMSAGHPRLVYRTTTNAATFAASMARAVATMLAPEIRRRAGLGPDDDVRVAVVRSKNATGLAYADKVLRELGTVQYATARLTAREIAVGELGPTDTGVLAAALDTLVAMRPHVVLALSDGLFPAVIAPLEQRLSGTENERPLYMAASTWEGKAFGAFIATGPERRARFFAISWPTSHRAMSAFVAGFNESFAEPVTPATASPPPYDSVYLLAYAAAAAAVSNTRIDGAALAHAIARLGPTAPELLVGPTSVVEGLAKVARGERVDLQGVVSRFDFDDETGDSRIDAVVQCTTYDSNTKLVDAIDIPIVPGPFRCP